MNHSPYSKSSTNRRTAIRNPEQPYDSQPSRLPRRVGQEVLTAYLAEKKRNPNLQTQVAQRAWDGMSQTDRDDLTLVTATTHPHDIEARQTLVRTMLEYLYLQGRIDEVVELETMFAAEAYEPPIRPQQAPPTVDDGAVDLPPAA